MVASSAVRQRSCWRHGFVTRGHRRRADAVGCVHVHPDTWCSARRHGQVCGYVYLCGYVWLCVCACVADKVVVSRETGP